MSVKAWADEEEKELINKYLHEEIEDPHELSEFFPGKGYRSVISKLVQLKIYKKPSNKEEEKSKTVKVMLREIENMLEIDVEGTNLNKKSNLVKLVEAIHKIRYA